MFVTASVQDSWTLWDVTSQRGSSLTRNDEYEGAKSPSAQSDDRDKNATNATNIVRCESTICSKEVNSIIQLAIIAALYVYIAIAFSIQATYIMLPHNYILYTMAYRHFKSDECRGRVVQRIWLKCIP